MKIINEYRFSKIMASYEKHELTLAMAGVIGAAIAAVSAIGNTISQHVTNEKNADRAEELTEKQWERDDSQFQRAVADAKAAGLSPLSAVNNGGGNTSAIMSTANAPQMDLSSLLGLTTSMADLSETKRHNIESEKIDREQIAAQTESLEKQLKNNLEVTKLNNEKAWERLQKSLEQQNKALEENKKEREQKYNEDISEKTFRTWEEIGNKYNFVPNKKFVHNWNEYTQELLAAEEKLNEILGEYAKTASPDRYGNNSNSSYGQGVNTGVGANAMGMGLNIQQGTNFNQAQGSGENADITRINSAKLAEMCKDLYWPVYISDYQK